MSEYLLTLKGEIIEHHGIKGQRWGQRLYQYKDGSLTPLGKIRYGRTSESGNKKTSNSKQNKISEMSNEELQAFVSRKRLEEEALKYFPKPERSTASKFFNSVMTKVVEPSLVTVGKQLLTKAMTDSINKSLKQYRKTPMNTGKSEKNAKA